MEDINDIKGPLELSFNYWPLIIVFVILFLLLFFLIYLSLKRRKPIEPVEDSTTPVIKISHAEIALKELEKVRKERLIELNKVDIFYNRISEILKKYLSEQYQTEIDPKTSMEIIMQLKSIQPDKDFVRQAELCLKDIDFAKYSSYKTSEKDMRESIELIFVLIKMERRLHL